MKKLLSNLSASDSVKIRQKKDYRNFKRVSRNQVP